MARYKPKVWRPRKNVVLTLRITGYTEARLKKQARKTGKTVSTLARHFIHYGLEKMSYKENNNND